MATNFVSPGQDQEEILGKEVHESWEPKKGSVQNPGRSGGVLFQASMILNIENAKSWPICPFWPILDIILQIYALFGIRFTGLHNAVVYQN